ncbi:rhodanese-like domain-containing protein [Anaerobacillus isosaccharinicus]|uniref:Rhodanese-like domain-containing protein n=1 Tax=Anaerobacillus isosaccharinicus TaxID=1532552 RepID=A0A1S2M328_9BACI|nr:rhodanese-like domain-containing protein [Anaerobacillus isosaccharinicus]MBA5588240.1 rhodanese-like domain-containing protein [Anaerobacillus isosaccharinicus]QOY38315.1 rhodanese-like domain-containing protein [Anaerobacillus isosaccharinicus]
MKKLLFSLLLLMSVVIIGCSNSTMKLNEITVDELLEIYETTGFNHEEVMYIDVREKNEFTDRHIEGFEVFPKSIIECLVEEISEEEKDLVIICNTQNRSKAVGELLVSEYGFSPTNITIVQGGVSSWKGPVVSGN